jgi:hypothetical protein
MELVAVDLVPVLAVDLITVLAAGAPLGVVCAVAGATPVRASVVLIENAAIEA